MLGRKQMLSGAASARIRWLALVAGCSAALAGGVSYSWLYLIFGLPLVLGAIIQPQAPTSGRWLMWVGALVLSPFIIPYGFAMARDMGTLDWTTGGTAVAISLLFIASGALLLLCDMALVIEGFQVQYKQWTRGRLDWVVWIVAFALSAWCARLTPTVAYAYRNGRPYELLINLGLDAAILVFDVALIVLATKSGQQQE